MPEIYIQRKLYSSDKLLVDSELVGQSGIFVVLAEPGAGKSHLLDFLSKSYEVPVAVPGVPLLGGRKMKTSRTEAAEARQRIVRAAADRFRRDGIAETGLAGFVPEAGLTAGGFYCYFYFQGRVVRRGTPAVLLALLQWGNALAEEAARRQRE